MNFIFTIIASYLQYKPASHRMISRNGYIPGRSSAFVVLLLLKTDKLTDNEYSEIKNHPTIGSHILSTASIFHNIIPIVKHHHERYDGNGYPSKLKGLDIPYFARITAVADTFDAMTSRRTYRNALPVDTVIAEIQRCKGTQFDPDVADVFLDILNNHYSEIEEIQERYN